MDIKQIKLVLVLEQVLNNLKMYFLAHHFSNYIEDLTTNSKASKI